MVGVDVGWPDDLVAVAASAGVPAADPERVPGSDEGTAEVLAEERHF